MTTAEPRLFQPIKVGNMNLKHRVVHTPCTRLRSTESDAPIPELVKEYYTQRASTPGTLLITEAVIVAPQAAGYKGVPGIWSEEQLVRWKEVVDSVHAKGSYIFCQLVAFGRGADPTDLKSRDSSYEVVGPSNLAIVPSEIESQFAPKGGYAVPRPLTKEEGKEYVELFATAATRAVHQAGFDGVEIHGANGALVDQFFQDVSNNRTDEYGGSPENRSRFALEIIEAVSKAIGLERTALRIGPWTDARGMGMKDPMPTFSCLATILKEKYPSLAYLHAIEPRVSMTGETQEPKENESNQFLVDIWCPRPLILAGGYIRDDAIEAAEREGVLIAYGRRFIANPDLPLRLMKNLALTHYDRSTFYIYGDTSGRGYTDYTFVEVK